MAAGTASDSSGAAAFELYNFHDAHELETAAAFLGGPGVAGEGPSVLVLSADLPGAGRSYFLESMAFRLRETAAPPRVVHLDLAGFEPDRPDAMAAFFVHQAGRHRAAPSRELAAGLAARSFPPHEDSAILMALLLALDEPEKTLAGLGDDAPAALIENLLGELAAAGPLVLHFADFAQLSEARRSALVELAERRPGLFVAFSCFGEADEKVAPGARFAVFRTEIEPLSLAELREALADRGATLAPEASEALWKATGGEPALIGPRLGELATDGLPESEIERELAALFAAHPHLDKLLRSVLLFGILCGEAFPPKLLLELMGVSEEEADEVIDLIDAELVDQLGWIDDLEFRHPGFPGLQVYRIVHPQLAGTVLHRVGAETASSGAKELLEALAHRLPPWTRSTAALHLALARHLAPAYQKPHLELLSGWTEPGRGPARAA